MICDVFDAEALAEAVAAFGPDSVFHHLTDLPDNVADMASFGARNDRIRGEGTRNLLAAAVAAGAEQFIAQSIAWDQSDDARRAVTAGHERTVLEAGGVVIRYGQFWGPGTYYETAPPARPAHPPGRRGPDDPGLARRAARRDPGGRRPRPGRLRRRAPGPPAAVRLSGCPGA